MERDDLDTRFRYHPPHGTQAERYERLRVSGRNLAELINELCPDSREKSSAMTNLEQSVMWANAAIARNEVPPREMP